MSAVDGCLPCQLEDSAAAAVVFRDDTWSCEVAAGYEVPGWYILRLRRHAEGWDELVPAELAGFGERCQRLSSAIQHGLGASHAYFMSFGENYPHFHFLVTARSTDAPPELRGANILKLRETDRDEAGALVLVPALRAALEADSSSDRYSPIPASS